MAKVPAKNADKKKIHTDKLKGDVRNNNPNRPSADLSALIDAIRNEGIANRAEDQREDRGKAFREKLTIGLIALTLIAVGWQVHEMMEVYRPIKDQAVASNKLAKVAEDTLIATQRPWISAEIKLGSTPFTYDAIGASLSLKVSMKNVGIMPASSVNTIRTMVPFGDYGDIPWQRRCSREGLLQRSSAESGFFYVLFPTDTRDDTNWAILSREDIEKPKTPMPVDTRSASFIVTVCVEYKFGDGTRNGLTAHTFWLLKANPIAGMGQSFDLNESPIPTEQLQLVPIGSYAH